MRQRRTSVQQSPTSEIRQASSHHGAAPRPTMWHRSRCTLLAGVSLCALLAAAPQVRASDILRGNTTASPVANVTAAQAAAMQQAQQAALQAQNSLARAVAGLQNMQAVQIAARAAAQAAASVVPNGLTAGGLMPDSGLPSGNNPPPSWQNVSSITQTATGSQTNVDIKQNNTQAILNWQTFNVGKDTTVNFDQQGNSGWIALNRVLDPTGNPSMILGNIKADGQVYIINQNGIIFGGASQINVGSLVASALPINDALVKAGTLFSNLDNRFTFSAYDQPGGSAGPTDPFVAPAATAATQNSKVIVEAGAQIATPLSDSHNGGRVALIGPQVVNNGSISTPDGQTILAAGQQVALVPHDTGNGTTDAGDPSLRGLDVYVGSILAPQIGSSTTASTLVTGTATNTGIIEVDRGNITMGGSAVVQNGALVSTTSVALNGRIDLNASYNAIGTTDHFTTFRTSSIGTVGLGTDSVTEILPELSSADTVVGTALALPSQMNITGNSIYIDGLILAPSGKITIGGGQTVGTVSLSLGSQIYLDANAVIDVSGSMGVQASVSENIIAVQLLGPQFANSPLQRDGVLRGQTVYVDINQTGTNADGSTWIGTPLADASGYVGLIQRTVGELTVSGGSITLNAGNSVVLQKGSLLNVSGGYIDYQGAQVQTTRLMSGSHLYDISQAPSNIVYDGVAGQFVDKHSHWGITETYSSSLLNGPSYQAGYIQGGNGGSITIQAPTAAIDGDLLGLTIAGERQRAVQAAPSSLSLIFQVGPGGALIPPAVTPNIVFQTGVSQSAAAFDPSSLTLDPAATITLSPDLVGSDGFGAVTVNSSNGSLSVLSPLTAKAGASNAISLTAASIDVEADITVPGGKINLNVIDISPTVVPQPPTGFINSNDLAGRGFFTLGANASLSVAGLIVDDRTTSSTAQTLPTVVNGGSVSLNGFFLDLETGSRVDASGGVAISGAGKVTNGNGGRISIIGGTDTLVDPAVAGNLVLGAQLSAYGVGTSGNGGNLSISAPAIQIGGTTSSATTLLLDPSFFDQGGFASFTLNGAGRNSAVPGQRTPGMLVASGTTIDPSVQSYAIEPMADGSIGLTPVRLPEIFRSPVSLSLNAPGVNSPAPGVGLVLPGDAVLGQGATIIAAPTSRGTASVSFGGTTATVLGSIVAPGGTISISGSTGTNSAVDPSITVDLAANSVISTAGVWLPSQDSFGNVVGSVLSGGSVTVSGNILGEQGALIDVSGASGIVQVLSIPSLTDQKTTPVAIDTNGGSITFNGGNELFTQATLRAYAGGAKAAGGNLSISSGPNPTTAGALANLIVTQHTPAGFTYQSGLAAIGTTVLNNGVANSLGRFAVNDFASGGFESLTLGGLIQFSGPDPVNIVAGKSIAVAGTGSPGCAGCISWLSANTAVSLTAPYIGIGLLSAAPQAPGAGIVQPAISIRQSGVPITTVLAPSFGSGSLTVEATKLLDVGTVALQGIGTTTLSSAGDVRGNGTFEAAGSVTIQAAQVYPVTEGVFTIMALDSIGGGAGSVTFSRSTSAPPQLPLSAGGILNVFASTIEQDGVLRAPIGEINLGVTTAQIAGNVGQIFPSTKNITLGDGSTTSVSAVDPVTGQNLIIPYGTMLNGTNWIDPSGTDITSGGVPGKTVNLSGVAVTVGRGATVDLSGGGDLYAYNWVKGTGGNSDILATSGSFAVIPGYQAPIAPAAQITSQNNDGTTSVQAGWSSSGLAVGDQIVLTASTNGLPGGTYTLLPARYALLPGAFLVTPVKGATATLQTISVTQPDGSSIVTGTRFNALNASRGVPPLATQYEVDSSAVVRARAEYDDFFANSTLSASAIAKDAVVPRLPVDAGQLVLTSTGSLVVSGTARMAAGQGGLGGIVSIASPNNIVINDDGESGGTPAPNTLYLSAEGLSDFGAQSLLIGGFVNTAGSVTVTTSSITLANDDTAALTGPDVTLVSNANLTIGANAVLQAKGTLSGSATPLLFGTANITGTGDGTLVRVSSDPGAQTSRNSTSVSIGGGVANLVVGANAKIQATTGTAVLDSTNAVSFDPSAFFSAASLSLGAGRISLQFNNGGVLQPDSGLVLPSAALASLQSAGGALSLLSYSSIDIYGTGTVGSADLGTLSMHAAGIRGFGQGGGNVTFTAKTVTLDNSAGGQAVAAVDGVNSTPNGTFVINGNTITLGSNTLNVVGYAGFDLNAPQGVLVQGSGGLSTAGNLTVTTSQIAGATGANQSITAEGALAINAIAGTATVNSGLGASLTLTGASVTDTSAIVLPSGTLALHATSGDVTVGDGGTLNVAGVGVAFFDQVEYSGGGQVTLTTDAGSVVLQRGSVVDVSAPAAAGDAGTLSASAAQGSFTYDGTLRGRGGTGGKGGAFYLDVDHLPTDGTGAQSLAALNSKLNDNVTDNTGGFTQTRNIRIRTGDVLANGTATTQTFNLSADAGAITVTGTIDASGTTGGSIALYAYNGVTLANGSELTVAARQFNDAGKGGSVDIETGEAKSIGGVMTPGIGWIEIQTGAIIDLSVNGGPGGTLHLRAPQIGGVDGAGNPIPIPVNSTSSGNDLAIKPLNGTIINPSSIVAEGYSIFDLTNSGVIDTSVENAVKSNGLGFTANTAAITSRLLGTVNSGLASVLHIQPGEEIVGLATLPLTLKTQGSSLTIPAGTGVTFANGTPLDDTVSFTSNGTVTASDGTVTHFSAGAVITVDPGSTVALDGPGKMSFVAGSTPISVSLKGAGTAATSTGSSTTITVANGTALNLNGVGSSFNLPANTIVTFANGIPAGDSIAVRNGTSFTAPAGGSILTLTTPGSGVVLGAATSVVLPAGDIMTSSGAFKTVLNGTAVSLGIGKTVTLPAGATVGLSFATGSSIINGINGATITTATSGGSITLNVSGSSSVKVTDNQTQVSFPNGTPAGDMIKTSIAATIINPDGTTTPLVAGHSTALAAGSSLVFGGSLSGGTVSFASGSTAIPVTLGVGAYTLSNLTSITSLPPGSAFATGTGSGILSAVGGVVSASLSAGQYTTTGQITALAAGTTFLGGTLALAGGSTPMSVILPASTFTTTGTGVLVNALAAGTMVKVTSPGALTVVDGQSPILLSLPAGSFTVNGAMNFALASDLVLSNDWNLNTFRYGPDVTAVLGSGEPGTLTLRTAGNLVFNGALSDGFGASPIDPSTHQAALWEAPLLAPGSQSWTYRLTAGADFTGVDAHDLLPSTGLKGSVMVGKTGTAVTASTTATTASVLGPLYQVIRTGTGDIDITAANDVQLLNQFATIYTAGSQVLPALSNGNSQYAFDTPNTAYAPSNSLGGPSPGPLYPAQFSSGGGNVTIVAGRDIIHLTTGGADDSSQELLNNWLYRRDTLINGVFAPTNNGDHGSTTWWVDYSNFFEGVGALGGGNVTLTAGRDVKNVDAVVPTNAWSPYQTTTTTSSGVVVNNLAASQPLFELGGGDLAIRAGRDINGGAYYVERGIGDLAAGRDVTTNTTRTALNVATATSGQSLTSFSIDPSTWLPTTLFLGEGSFQVTAGSDIFLGSVTSPFLLPPGINNSYWDTTYFTTFGPTDSVTLSSLAGAVTIRGNNGWGGNLTAWVGAIQAFGTPRNSGGSSLGNTVADNRPWLRTTTSSVIPLVGLAPPVLKTTAFSGDVGILGSLTTMPSSTGTIDIEAAGSINGLQPIGSNGAFVPGVFNQLIYMNAFINLSDANPGLVPTVDSPIVPATADLGSSPSGAAALFSGAGGGTAGLLHANDQEPLHLYAVGGDISDVQLNAAKPVNVIAGRDITDIQFTLQNNSVGDVSMVVAGRDIRLFDPNNKIRQAVTDAGIAANAPATYVPLPIALAGNITIAGPGSLEVLAGRNLVLNAGGAGSTSNIVSQNNPESGIISIGNSNNPFLPLNQGATVIAAAGVGIPSEVGLSSSNANFSAFISDFLNPATTGGNATRFLPELGELLGMSGASNQDIWNAFNSKPAEQKAAVALDMFYLVLRDAGRDHNNGDAFGGYNVGRQAIADLFPGDNWSGNILLTSREIETTSGGDIDLLAPGGNIVVGFDLADKQPLDQGILTLSAGNISIFADGDVTVGTSRIFTFRGGNEVIWSTNGNIAAGAASKTLVSAPPTRFLIDPRTGVTTLDVAGIATGGGIGVLQTVVGAPTGNIDLIAPNGFVDAGDAGIRVSGNINIAAVQVLNAGNIQVGGTSTGVPTVQAPNVAGLTAASNTAGAASKAAGPPQADTGNASQPSILIVEVEGYGGDDKDDKRKGQ